jgi:hypothetical protein
VSIDDLHAAKDDFERWRPQVDSRVADLRSCVDSLRNQVAELCSTLPKLKTVAEDGHVFTKSPGPAHLGPFPSGAAQGLLGHIVESNHRGLCSGGDATLKPPLIKGEPHTPPTSPHNSFEHHFNSCCHHANFNQNLPQQEFPKFSGSNPKFWIKQCESYFNLYDIPSSHWVKLATINFVGTAAFWMQTIELNLRKCS